MTTAPKRRRSGPSGPSVPHAQRPGVRIDLQLPEDLAAAVDELRGDEPRASWIRRVVANHVTTQTGPSVRARRSREARYERRRVALEESRRQMVDRDEQ